MKNFCIVWLNPIDPDDSTINLLGPIWKAILVLQDVRQCSDLIQLVYEEKVILIVSEGLVREILPLVNSMTQIDSVYIYSEEQISVEQLKSNWSKIKGSFSDLSSQCRSFQRWSRACNSTPISINILPSDRNISGQPSNQLDSTFMWTQLLKELILEDSNDPKQFKKMFDYLRQKFAGDSCKLQTIDNLETSKGYHSQQPIFWYTSEPIFYEVPNEALRDQDVETIIRLGPHLHGLHHDIERLYREQSNDPTSQPSTVYRGQAMSRATLDRLKANKSSLLSFNCFLSTSTEPSLGEFFADSNAMRSSDQNTVAVLFEIHIDTSRNGSPFALIDKLSLHKDEEEVLFSMHTIFRLKKIEPKVDNDRIWLIELELTDENDEQFKKITEVFRKQLHYGLPSRHRIAALLKQLIHEDLALKLYEELLELANSEEEKALLYGRIGSIKSNKGHYLEAKPLLERAISMYEHSIIRSEERTFLTSEHAAEIYSAMGTLYCRSNGINKALDFYMKAMMTDPTVLETYLNTATVLRKMGQYSKALWYCQRVLDRVEDYPEDHPDLAVTYDKIADMHMMLDENGEALNYYTKALASREKTRHPSLGQSYSNLGVYHGEMKEIAKADEYFQKALNFYKASPPSDRELSVFYRKLGKFNTECKRYPLALEYLNKALEIMQRTLMDPYDDDFVDIYYQQAVTYLCLKDYDKAEPLFGKALKMWQKNSPETADVVSCYGQMGVLHFERDRYPEALSSLGKAIEIYKRISHQGPSIYVKLHINMGCVHAKIGAITEAFSCWNDALEVAHEKLHETDPIVQTLHKYIKMLEDKCNQQRGT